MIKSEVLRTYHPVKPISVINSNHPPLYQLLEPIIDTSIGINSRPGIAHVQSSILDILSMLSMHFFEDQLPEKKGSISGSLLYRLFSIYADQFGLVDKNSLVEQGTPQLKIYTSDHFSEAVKITDQWSKSGHTIGIFHGAFDYPQLGHAMDTRDLYPYTDKSIVVVDPNWLVKRDKEVPGDPRPRVDSIIWKMWQFAVLPTVDMVLEAPIEKTDELASFWAHLYQKMHITRLVAGRNHRYLSDYRERMAIQNGFVIESRSTPKLFLLPSTTSQLRSLAKSDYAGDIMRLRRSDLWGSITAESRIYEKLVEDRWSEQI